MNSRELRRSRQTSFLEEVRHCLDAISYDVAEVKLSIRNLKKQGDVKNYLPPPPAPPLLDEFTREHLLAFREQPASQGAIQNTIDIALPKVMAQSELEATFRGTWEQLAQPEFEYDDIALFLLKEGHYSTDECCGKDAWAETQYASKTDASEIELETYHDTSIDARGATIESLILDAQQKAFATKQKEFQNLSQKPLLSRRASLDCLDKDRTEEAHSSSKLLRGLSRTSAALLIQHYWRQRNKRLGTGSTRCKFCCQGLLPAEDAFVYWYVIDEGILDQRVCEIGQSTSRKFQEDFQGALFADPPISLNEGQFHRIMHVICPLLNFIPQALERVTLLQKTLISTRNRYLERERILKLSAASSSQRQPANQSYT